MPKLIETLTQEQLDNIVDLYNQNVSLRQIENITGFGRRAISLMLEDIGVKTTKGNHYRKYFFDFNFFEKIENELQAYWLGFLYADGCILPQNKYGEQEFKIQIKETDLELLTKFKDDINSSYPIRYDYSKLQSPIVIQSLRCQKTVEDLKKLGCVEKKSLILEFPTEEQVPKKLLHHFIRGYFDGDGSISKTKRKNSKIYSYNVSFVGTENFIKSLYNILKIGSVLPDKRKTNSWYLNIGGNQQIERFYHILYDDATRYMNRKYLKFQELLKQNESSGKNI